MRIDIPKVLYTILQDCALPLDGYHCVAHWVRVIDDGMLLSAETGAAVKALSLFAILHDSRPQMEATLNAILE